MKALLLVAHGSRKPASNAEICELAAQLRAMNRETDGANNRTVGQFDLVEHAFLEMTEPSIVRSGNKLVAAGATAVSVFPYFLAAGQHVAIDIPAAVAMLQQQHPTVPFTITPHLGTATGIPQLILNHLHIARFHTEEGV